MKTTSSNKKLAGEKYVGSGLMLTIESDDEVAASESDASDDEADGKGGGGISFTFDDVSLSISSRDCTYL